MSQLRSPEKKKPRRSLSLSKNRTGTSPKSKPCSSILTLFENAPPAKLACPLCGEMVPRFGMSKHMDESCPKASHDENDVILIESQDCVTGPRRAEDNPGIPGNADVTTSPPGKLGGNEKQVSPYFTKNSPTPNTGSLQVMKSLPLGNLSSKLSRKCRSRRASQGGNKESDVQDFAKDIGDVEKSILDKEEIKTSKRVILSSKSGNQSEGPEHNTDDAHQNHCPNPPACHASKSAETLKCKPTDHTKASKPNLEECALWTDNSDKKVKHGNVGGNTASPRQCDEPRNMSSAVDQGEFLTLEDSNILNEFLKPFDDEVKKEHLGNGTEAGSLQESSSEDVRHPYYLRNFLMVLNTVMESEEDMSLFNEDDRSILTSFYQLTAGSQKLYVRLFQRKLCWIKVNKIEYTEIGSDLGPFIDQLVQGNFLQSESELQDLAEALDLLSAPEIKTLAKSYHLANVTAQKQLLVEEFLRLSRQRSVFNLGKNQPGIAAVILKKCKQLSGRSVRVCRAPRAVFSRVLLLFSLTDSMEVEEAASGGQSQLSTVLMVNMGRMTFPPYTVSRTTRIFGDREELLKYEAAMHRLVEVVVTMTNGKWEEAHELYQNAIKEWDELKNDSMLRCHEALPVYLRCFTVGWVYTRILSRGVEILQRLHLYEEAVELLQTLLWQNIYCTDSRGRWWDRLVLNLHQHLKRTEKAISFIMEGLSDPYVRTGHQLSLYQRAVRMRDSPSCKKFCHMFSSLPIIAVEDVLHVTIKGKMYPQTGMGKSVFIMKDVTRDTEEDFTVSTVMCSVEELALAHYREQGFDQGIHGEGSTFCTLYGLLMWDIVFMEGIPDVFRNSYQSFPLDLYTDCFFENRREAIETRLQLLEESGTETLQQLIVDVWSAHEGQAGALVSWERFTSLQQVQSLVSCFGGSFLSGVCRIMSKDIRHCRGGLPDLVVWNTQSKEYKVVEVKGPNDRLSHKQMVWLHELKKMGAAVEISSSGCTYRGTDSQT
uniref:Fanconi-associated nuclease n=1 Tax=Leptobrachium leishanense TaxID=445787 RepID=A0A8C5M5R4_9ANUR